MTPTRLRDIATLIESQCLEIRTLSRRPERIPCDGCKAAARELRELADWAQRNRGLGPIEYERIDARGTEVVGI